MKVVAVVVQLLFGQGLARQGELQNRHGGRVVGKDQRRQYSGREIFQQRRRIRGRLRNRAIDVRAGWKNTLITVTPFKVCDSMCSMLSTSVVSARSTGEVTRSAMSSRRSR